MFQIINVCFLIIFGFNFCRCFEEAWYSYQSDLKNANREELVITGVTTDENFMLDFNVTKWTSLSTGSVCYTAGLMDKGIVVLFSTLNLNHTTFDITSKIIDLTSKPIDVILLATRKRGTTEIYLVVAYLDLLQLDWYIFHENDLNPFGSWQLQHPVVHINAFQIKERSILLLASDYHDNTTAVDLYEYTFKEKAIKYRICDSLDLQNPARSSAFSNFEYDYYLSVPQTSLNSVLIYKYEGYRFVAYSTITSAKVHTVVSFEIGFKTFLAFDGFSAGIYQFTRTGIQREEIVNSNLNGIHYWLPIPIRTYWDDVILFAQRTLDYQSHKSIVIEIVTFNGGKFEEHEDIPCSHFGEQQQVLNCLEDGGGIIGSSYISVDDHLGLIVPKSQSSLLFMIHSAIKELPNPKEEELRRLAIVQDTLKKLIESNNKEYEELKNLKKKSVEQNIANQENPMNNSILSKARQEEDLLGLNERLEAIGMQIRELKDKVNKIAEKESRTEFNKIIINGDVEIQGEGIFKEVVVDTIKEVPATELLEDIVRKDNISRIPGKKTFSELEVANITFKTLNGNEANELVFENESSVTLNGDITFTVPTNIQSVHILSGKINNFDVENDIIYAGTKYNGTLDFDNMRVTEKFEADEINNLGISSHKTNSDLIQEDTVFIPENMTVNNINGENVDAFIKELCLINIKCYIPGHIKINGDIVAEEAFIEYLNDVKFPEEYLMKDTTHHSNITGKKTFLNSLTAKEIRSRGTIDGVDTKELITLSTDQEIPGKIVFGDITVSEELNVTGKIFGEHIDKFLPNPTLEFVDTIKANVNFKSLEVEGDIIVENSVNKKNFTMSLNDLVYMDEDNATISSQKDFPKGFKVNENFIIATNSVNEINLDQLVTKDTDQTLAITFLKGDVTFANLFINGTYDGESVTELDEKLVKLNGEQYISSTLIFRDDIQADHFEITGTLNDVEAEKYLYIDGNREIDTELEFEDIEAENIFVKGDIEGNLADIDLSDLSQKYLSYTKDQTIDYHYSINNSLVDDVVIKRINDIDYEDLFNYNKFTGKIQELIDKGQINVENLYVNGSMQIETINNRRDDDWLPWSTFLNKEVNGTRKFATADDVYFETIEINRLSYVKWDWFNEQLIPKNEVNVKFTADATKTFTDGFKVKKLIETEKINGIPIKNIFKKVGSRKIKGPVTVKGDVHFKDDVTVYGDINEVPVDKVLEKFTVANGTYNIKSDMIFRKLPHIYNLEVQGHVNEKNTTDHFGHIVNVHKDSTLHGHIVFENTVNVSGNLAVDDSINNINLMETLPQIVLTTNDADIQGPVSFSQPVFVRLHLSVDQDLVTDTLFGIDVNSEWKNNTIFVDRGLLLGNYKFEEVVIKDDLIVKFINDIDINSLIPLRSNQSISYLEFEEITAVNNITVGNLVNGYNLSNEFAKTVMVHLDQDISSNITFEDVILIRQSLSTPFINGQKMSKIVTLNTDQNLTSIFNFNSKCRMNSHFKVYGLISGININEWNENAIRTFSPHVQEVYDDWIIAKNMTFKDNVTGDGLIGSFDLPVLMEEVNRKKSLKSKVERAIINDYENLCTDVTYLYRSAKKQIYKFQYFDDLQTISFENHIEYSHYFEHENNQYLLVNDNNCSSHLFVFNNTSFDPLNTVKTGHVAQVVPVYNGDTLYLVTRNRHQETECDIGGTYIWLFRNHDLTLDSSIEDLDLLQESLVPGTFYGLNRKEVVEYKLSNNDPKKYRKWNVFVENAAFVPRGLRTGLALRTGHEIVFLDRTDPVVEYDFGVDVESTIIGNTSKISNYFIPGRNGGDLVVTSVGIKSSKRNLLAVATHEETSVKGSLDFVKIYENALNGDLFHKVPTYKPSSLVSIEFNQGETLLAFMENERTLQIYEYKGIEGFKHRTSAKIKASKLFLMTLPIEPYLNPRNALGIMHENKITIIQSVMLGNQISDDLICGL